MQTTTIACVCAIVISMTGCNKHDSTQTASGEQLTPASGTHSAAESIAQSRCDRERRCNNVGTDRKYASDSDCLLKIRGEWRQDLSALECQGGINQKQLNECLTRIRNEDCGSPFDTLSRVSECTQSQVCETASGP